MKKIKLKNGLTIIIEPKRSETITIHISVFTGSNNEPAKIAGISHFLEHMMFEGTKKRKAAEINGEIENIGGEINAMTGNERTSYYVKVPKKFYRKGLDVLSDMLINSVFDSKSLEKERKVILEEIKMTSDQPLFYQWILFLKTIYKKHPSRNAIYGTFESVKGITRQQMIDYFNKYYVANNMTITVVGDVKNILPEIKRCFLFKKRHLDLPKQVIEPMQSSNLVKREKKNIQNSYVILGYKTVPRKHKDSYTLDIIRGIFSRGLSGRVVEEIRLKRGLVYSVNCGSETFKGFGFFCVTFNCAKANMDLCRNLFLKEVERLKKGDITQKEIDIVKDYMEGKRIVENEDSQRQADELAFWENIGDAKLSRQFFTEIRKVKKADVVRVANKYFNNYTMTSVEPK